VKELIAEKVGLRAIGISLFLDGGGAEVLLDDYEHFGELAVGRNTFRWAVANEVQKTPRDKKDDLKKILAEYGKPEGDVEPSSYSQGVNGRSKSSGIRSTGGIPDAKWISTSQIMHQI
jgi:hypothetical protein